MAELGSMANVLGGEYGGSKKEVEIRVDMLDYGFIAECADVAVLKGIVEKLQTNEYGYYPELEKSAEQRLMSLLPPAEALKMRRLQHKTTPQEVADAQDTLSQWESSIQRQDANIRESVGAASGSGSAAGGGGRLRQQQQQQQQQESEGKDKGRDDEIFPAASASTAAAARSSSSSSQRKLPAVRGSTADQGGAAAAAAGAGRTFTTSSSSSSSSSAAAGGRAEPAAAAARLSGYDFQAWDKYDEDAALEQLDKPMGRDAAAAAAAAGSGSGSASAYLDGIVPAKSLDELKIAAAAKRSAAHQKEMQNLQKTLGADALTALQRSARANREKLKGNECFKVGENQEAFDCYARSLALDPTNPVTYSNRAIAAIRLERYELAEDDCSRAIRLDATYLKAWSRRGMTRFKRGNYSGAVGDFDEAIRLDPASKGSQELRKMWANAREKYLEVEGKTLPLRDAADPTSVSLVLVRNFSDFPIFPSSSSSSSGKQAGKGSGGVAELAHGRCTVVRPVAAGDDAAAAAAPVSATRIAISDDTDSDSEGDYKTADEGEGEGEGEGEAAAAKPGFVRIAISEDSDSDSDSESETPAPVPVPVPAPAPAAAAAPAVVTAEAAAQALSLKTEGNTLYKAGRHGEAVAAYSRSLLLDSSAANSSAWNNRSMAYLALQRYAEVVQDTSRVLALEPDNVKALYRRAKGQYHLSVDAGSGSGSGSGSGGGGLSQAAADIARVLQLDAANAQAAELQRDIGRATAPTAPTAPTGAVGKTATPKAAPTSSSAPAGASELDMDKAKKLAIAALEEGDCLGAARVLRAALASDYFKINSNANSVEVKVGLLHLLYTASLRNGDSAEAQAALAKILALQPNNFKALVKRAEVLKSLGKTEQALADVRLALTVDPKSTVALSLLASLGEESAAKCSANKSAGNVAMAEGRFAEAVALYTAALQDDPTSIVPRNNRAQAYLKLERYAEAITDANEVIARCADHEDQSGVYRKALFRRAYCYREQGGADSTTAALRDFNELLQLEPNNKTFLSEMQRTESALQALRGPGAGAGAGAAKTGGTTTATATATATAEAGAALKALGLSERTSTKRVPPLPPAEQQGQGQGETALPPAPPSPADKAGAGADAARAAPKAASAASATTTAKVVPALKPPTVPTDLPKTVYELEKVWRALKAFPALLVEYLALFKKSTFKKAFKDTVSSELLSSVFAAVRDHAPAAVAVNTLQGIAGMAGFDMTLALLPAGDLQAIAATLAAVSDRSAEHAADVTDLRALYKVK